MYVVWRLNTVSNLIYLVFFSVTLWNADEKLFMDSQIFLLFGNALKTCLHLSLYMVLHSFLLVYTWSISFHTIYTGFNQITHNANWTRSSFLMIYTGIKQITHNVNFDTSSLQMVYASFNKITHFETFMQLDSKWFTQVWTWFSKIPNDLRNVYSDSI